MTRNEAIDVLKRKQGGRSLRAFAAALGVSAAYLSDVYRQQRDLGPKLLKAAGLTKSKATHVRYERAR